MLAPARKSRTRLGNVTPDRRRKMVNDYVTRRFKEEIAAGPRGTASRLARELDISTAHITNLISSKTRQIGEEVRDKLAAHWGMTPAQLEAVATGRAASGVRPPIPDPTWKTLISQIGMRPALQAELLKDSANWRVSTIVRAVTTHWESPDGAPREGWAKVLEAIESGEIDQMSGGAEDATNAAKKQVGRRVKLPKTPHTQ
jgi:hypothetical protein